LIFLYFRDSTGFLPVTHKDPGTFVS
jgi:hypothetical protein